MESTNTVVAAPVNLCLYSVMLPWHTNDPGQGTYESSVWAESYDAAKRAIAEEMADHPDSGCESDEERANWVESLLDNCSNQSVVLKVSDTVVRDLQGLFAGPSGELSSEAKYDFEAALDLLRKHVDL